MKTQEISMFEFINATPKQLAEWLESKVIVTKTEKEKLTEQANAFKK